MGMSYETGKELEQIYTLLEDLNKRVEQLEGKKPKLKVVK